MSERDLADIQADVKRLSEEADELLEGGGTSTDLVHVGQGAPEVKRTMLRRKQEAEAKRQQVQSLREEMRELMERQMAEVEAKVGPLRELVRVLEEGIWTVNLYLGRDEKIKTLREGKPAPADTPIHIRQLVLAMDEETAIGAEEGGLDFQDVKTFDKWLMESDAHLDQVLPDAKGVVAIRPRNERTKDYGNEWANTEAAKRDRHTYFLIRNGEQVYRLWTEFSVGDHMVPPANEFTKLFERRRYDFAKREDKVETIRPGDHDWEKAEKQVEARQRHYMRMGLVLQGLADRTAVFHPLPEFGVNFLDSQSHREGKVRFILDAEQGLTTGREPFREWQLRINAELRPGMRIVGAFNTEDWRMANDHRNGEPEWRISGHSRVRPHTAKHPTSFIPHRIEERKGEDLIIRYVRDEEIYDPKMWVPSEDRPGWGYRGGYKKPKTRASAVVRATDKFIIAIDFAEVDEMEEYLRARLDRHEYLEMFPLLKAAIRVKREEAEAEAPFLELLASEMEKATDASIAKAKEDLPGLVRWWKLKNREHRALLEDDSKALQQIVAEYVKRRKLDKTATPPELLAKLQREHPDALVIARRSDGYHVVLEPEDAEDVYVAVHVYTKTGKPRKAEHRRWVLAPRTASSWRIFYAHPRWRRWRRGASKTEYLTGPERDALVRKLRAMGGYNKKPLVAITYDLRNRNFERWTAAGVEVPRKPSIDFRASSLSWPSQNHRWVRTPNGEAEVLGGPHGYDHRYIGKAPWKPEGRAQYGDRRVVLWENPQAIAKVEQRVAKVAEIAEASEPLKRRWRKIVNAVGARRNAQLEQAAKDAFLAEYGDESLWEGHRKTLKSRDLEVNSYEMEHELDWLKGLIEEGVEVEKMTAGEAAKRAGATISEWLSEIPLEPEPDPEDDEDEEGVRTFTVENVEDWDWLG